MKSKAKYFFYVLNLILIVGSFNGNAQIEEEYVDDIIPPSPEALSITKYGNTDVNLYNGIPNISIPIWTCKSKNINIPIKLNYNGGGIKVNDIASSVGLGWSLQAGGVVSREVRSLPDDMAGLGFLDSDQLVYPSNLSVEGRKIAYDYMMNKKDSQQDIFNVNFCGHAFTFVMNKNGEIFTDPVANYKIEMITGNLGVNAYGNIIGWDITNENGVLYRFREKEFSKYLSDSDSHNAIANKPYVSSWYLSQIKAPFNDTEINLTYNTFYSTYYLPKSQSYNPEWIEISRCIYLTSKKISTITTPVDTITFAYDPTGFRQDLPGDKALSSISINSGYNSKLFDLSYKYMYNSQLLNYTGCSSCTNGLVNNNRDYRLILTEVKESGTNPYVFDYFTGLPSRDSYSVDHWGYFNGKNNSSFVPLTYFYITLEQGYYLSYGNADRKVDSTFTKCGTLYNLTYPTGGSSVYEYENNDSNNPYLDYKIQDVKYLLDGVYNNSKEIEVSNFSAPFTTFKFILNILPPCFEDPFCTIYFHIKNQVTGVYEATVSFTRNEFDNLDRIREVQLLLPNGTYDFCYSYDSNPICNLDDPFSCSLSYTNQLDDVNKFAGGLRIKSITDKLANGDTAFYKTYLYKDKRNLSTGYILNYPVYLTIWDEYGNTCDNAGLYFASLTSNSKTALSNTKGAPVGYSRVIEYSTRLGSNNGYTEYKFTSPEHFPDVYAFHPKQEFPFSPPSSFENFRGKLKEKNIYNSSDELIRKEVNTYSNIYSWEDLYFPNIKVARDESWSAESNVWVYYFETFSNYFTNDKLLETTITDFYGSNGVSQTIVYSYENNYNKLRSKKWNNSLGDELTDSYYYSFDFASSGNIYQAILDSNFIEPVIQYKQTIDKNKDGTADETVKGQKTNYEEFGGNTYYPGYIEDLEDGIYRTKIFFDNYDDNGNLIQHHKTDNVNIAYLWGYNNSFPVAKVENSTIEVVRGCFTSSELSNIENGSYDDSEMRNQLNKIRTLLPGAFVTTYTYAPLIGITSETDPAGRTTYYEYDNYGRLKLIKDQNTNIVKKYEYNYAGQTSN